MTVGLDNRAYHFTKASFEFLATAGVMQLNAFAFATDKAGFPQNFKMLGRVDFGRG
jgi:hypothetical protein